MAGTIDLHSAVTDIITKPGVGVLMAAGPTKPADGADGYAPGCIFIHQDGATANTVLYVNQGSVTSAAFKHLAPITEQSALTTALTSITIADAEGTPDYAMASYTNSSAWGFASEQELITFTYVVQNMQTRINELEAALQAIGLLPSA